MIHKNERYDRMLFDKTVIGLALCKMNGDLVDVNSAYAELLGRSIEETLTLSYWQITPEKYAPQEQIQLESLKKTGKYGPYEKEYIHSTGRLIPVRLSGQIVEINGEKYIWSSIEDITDRKQVEEKVTSLNKELEQLSLQDGLTGISNRRMIDKTLEIEWHHAQRDQTPISLIMLDIDYFKQFNDYYGHLKGDECLKKVAKALCKVSRRSIDLVGRYGGEEFIVLLPAINKEQAIDLTKQCINEIKQLKIPHKHSEASNILSISAGVSTIIPSEDQEPSILIEAADRLLYQAKKEGRNQYKFQQEY